MNWAELTTLECIGLGSILFVLLMIAIMITCYLVANSKRHRVYRWIMSLDDRDFRKLERALGFDD